MAGIHMRTWFLLTAATGSSGSGVLRGDFAKGQPDAKKRVPVPVEAGTPYALASKTGCPEGKSARRTAAPLA